MWQIIILPTTEKGVKQGKSSYPLLLMKKDQANKMNVERVYRWWPLAWEPGLNGSGVCQGVSETGNVSCPSAHGTPMDLQNGRSRGWIPAECLEQKMLYAYATVCTQGDFTLSRK